MVAQGFKVTCTHPIILNRGGDDELVVPCNKCLPCRIAHSREWATRCVHESYYHQNNVFVTLTYNTDNLPLYNSLYKEELQLYFKRLRKSIEPTPIKYFACGEYGEEHGRPHYHAIIFGLGIKDKEVIENAWQNRGFIYLGSVTYDSARYVADYIGKKYYGLYQQIKYGSKKLPPFQLQSRGIGLRYCTDNQEQIKQKLGITLRGNEVGIPNYYKRKLDLSAKNFETKKIQETARITKAYSYLSDKEVSKKYLEHRKQKEKEIWARKRLRNDKL